MKTRIYFSLLLLLLALNAAYAQWDKRESVLCHHTWYKVGVTEDGVYGIGVQQLRSLGVDPATVNPSQIRVFGNVTGVLPEANAASRFDDLEEIAIQVTGSLDGAFDGDDQVLFYGQGPANMKLNMLDYYTYAPNLYSDTVYYFLCIDSGVQGLRIQEVAPVTTTADDPVVSDFLDYLYQDHDEVSPYASGREWYCDLITAQEGAESFVFETPGRVVSKAIRITSKVLGRCKTPFSYNLRLNERVVLNQSPIAGFGDYEYGKESEVDQAVHSDQESITVRYEINANGSNPMLFVEHFVLHFWRELRLYQNDLGFRLLPSQLRTTSRVLLSDVSAQVTCWDVTNPMQPARQPLSFQSGNAFFGVAETAERRFHLFAPSGVKAVESVQLIPNQNLHALMDAELLIITPKVFQGPAEELAEFHRTMDGMTCVLADIDEIYNEFGTGMHDPTAMRDFIRMLYLRSEGRLKYVLLMGKASHDYRDLKGLGYNFVPTYESNHKSCLEVVSVCTDDYFALMDLDEGQNCEGFVDLGVGRLPITTEAQGYDVVRKIKHYADLSAIHGPWKNTHLFLADNDSKTYVNNVEYLDRMMDTVCHSSTTKKIYIDSYPLVSTPSGMRCPQAHDELMRSLTEGCAVLSYTGHGGMKGLTSELVLSNTDVIAMDNYDKLPFVHTATCEFSKYDSPTVISAGELMVLNPNGGAIALLTTVRPTYPGPNQKLSMSFTENVYDFDEDGMLRFGDIYQRAKSNQYYYSSNNLVYVLFGDPALRFSYPTSRVNTSKINGAAPFAELAFHSSELMTVEGFISSDGGRIDNLFNGMMDVTLYGGKSEYTTFGAYDIPLDYAFYHDVLFEGKATVSNGLFSIQIPLPYDIGQGEGFARLSYYAYDTVRSIEANGVFDHLRVLDGGAASQDTQAPEIHLYWNTPDFESGDVVARTGTLYADVFDASGIYHYNVSIGRDMVLNSNCLDYNNLIVNNFYEPALDDYQRGRIAVPVNDLDDGTYEFSLKVWDTQNNVGEATIVLTVERSHLLSQVVSYPNPFTEEVWFSFVHGELSEPLQVVIEVFDIFGRRVATLHEQTAAESGVVPPIHWDGRSDHGNSLVPGVYVYRMTITDSKGKAKTITQRMVRR